MPDWLAALEPGAHDVVAAWRGIEPEKLLSVRREVRRRAGAGSAGRILAELDTMGAALVDLVESLPEDALAMPGGEADWNVAQTVGHVAASRAGIVVAAGLAAARRWPIDRPPVTLGIPGPAAADRPELVRKLAQSQRIIARAAAQIAGHETDPCSLDHPLVGRLRCDEWLLFAGVHDVMHLEQLHEIETSMARTVGAGSAAPAGEPAR